MSLAFVKPSRIEIGSIAVAIFAIVLVVFGQTLKNNYVTLDDIQLIYSNPTAKGLNATNIKAAFTTFDPELYVPLTMMSYQTEYSLFGMKPGVTHAVNLFLHALSAFFVFWFLYLLSGKRSIAMLCGLLFALHPLHTEAVAWASARKDVLSAFFFLTSLTAYTAYLRYYKKLLYGASLVLFFLGLLSKVTVIGLPIILVLIDYYIKRPITRKIWMEKLPFLALSVLFGLIALFGKKTIVAGLTVKATMLMAAKSSVFYLSKLFWPHTLSVMYPQSTPIALTRAEFFVPVLILIALCVVVLAFRKRYPVLLFGALFFALTVIPSFINFAKAGEIYFASDRYAYLPSIGFFLILATFAVKLRKFILAPIAAALLILFAAESWMQVQVWKDSVSLFSHVIDSYPTAAAAQFNLGVIALNSADDSGAIKYFKASIDAHPRSNAYSGLASALRQQGRYEDAETYYKKAMELDRTDPEPHFGLADLYFALGRTEDATKEFETTLEMDPNYVAAYNNYGVMLMDSEQYEKAETMFKKARDINPTFSKTHFNLGKLYQMQRKTRESVASFELALKFNPEDIDTKVNLAAEEIVSKHAGAALTLLKEVLAVDSENEQARALLNEMLRLGMIGERK